MSRIPDYKSIVSENKGIEYKKLDLLELFREITPNIIINTEITTGGNFNNISFGQLESFESNPEKKLNVAISNPLPESSAYIRHHQLLRDNNVVSPFIMYPLYQSKTGLKVFEAADTDLFDFVFDEDKKAFKNSFLTAEQIQCLIGQIVLAVDVLHSHGLAHRDLKTKNILVFKLGHGKYQLKITDFDFLVKVNEAGRPIDKNIPIIGSKNYLPPEFFQAIEAKEDGLSREVRYGNLNLQAFDCYALWMIFDSLWAVCRGKYTHPLAAKLYDLLAQLKHKNPKKRASIQAIKNHAFFGRDAAEREQFFQKLKHEYDLSYINGFCHASGPEADDKTSLLPESITQIYFEVQKLEIQMNYLQEWAHIPAEEKIDSDSYLNRWLNFQASQLKVIQNAAAVLQSINTILSDHRVRKNKDLVIKLAETKNKIFRILRNDKLINSQRSIRRKINQDIISFVKLKEALYFKLKFFKNRSELVKLPEEKYFEQWLAFRANRGSQLKLKEKISDKANHILQTIDAELRNDAIIQDKSYCDELRIMRDEIMRQQRHLDNKLALFDVEGAIRDLYNSLIQFRQKFDFSPISDETPAFLSAQWHDYEKSKDEIIEKAEEALEFIESALTNTDVRSDKECCAELMLMKTKIENLKNKEFKNDYTAFRKLTAKALQQAVNEAYKEYMDNFRDNSTKKFYERIKFSIFHGKKGQLRARKLITDLNDIMISSVKNDQESRAAMVYEKIIDFLSGVKSGTSEYSFKTIVKNKLQKISKIPIDEWKYILYRLKTSQMSQFQRI